MTSDRKINAKITLSQLHCIPLNLINDILSTPHKTKYLMMTKHWDIFLKKFLKCILTSQN